MQRFETGLQLLLTFIPLLLGAGIGGGLGYFYARWLRKRIGESASIRRKLLLFPWRSVVVTLPFLSFFIPIFVGLGVLSGVVIVGLFVILFTAPFTANTLLNNWYPLPLRIRLLSLARIISVAAISVATATGLIGGFAAGMQMFGALRLLDYSLFFDLFYTVFVVALLVDVLFGVMQYVFYRAGSQTSAESVNR
jgi:hypothetical protein